MKERNPVQGDNTKRIILAILVLTVFRLFFYHHGGAVLQSTRDTLSLLLPNGHVYPAPVCKNGLGSDKGNSINFTAIGLDINTGSRQLLTPLVIRCEFTGFWVDEFNPLQ